MAAIGRNTIAAIQSGMFFGYVGLVDGIVERMVGEIDFAVRVVATGGLAELIADGSRTIEETDELLTLKGLRILHRRNRAPRGSRRASPGGTAGAPGATDC